MGEERGKDAVEIEDLKKPDKSKDSPENTSPFQIDIEGKEERPEEDLKPHPRTRPSNFMKREETLEDLRRNIEMKEIGEFKSSPKDKINEGREEEDGKEEEKNLRNPLHSLPGQEVERKKKGEEEGGVEEREVEEEDLHGSHGQWMRSNSAGVLNNPFKKISEEENGEEGENSMRQGYLAHLNLLNPLEKFSSQQHK